MNVDERSRRAIEKSTYLATELKPREHNAKVLVIFSGGMDSTTLIYMYRKLGYEVHAVSFDYGQKHSEELKYARNTCKKLDIDHHIMKCPIPSKDSCLVDHGKEVPEGHYEDETMKKTVVNNRNSIMISLATALAMDIGADTLALGIHTGDHAIYADCRGGYFNAIRQAMILGNEDLISKDFDIKAPFVTIDKTDIAELAILLEVPLEETYSDYEGGEVQKAKSGTSVERIEAISLAYQRVNTLKSPFTSQHKCDPTKYIDKEFALNLLLGKAVETKIKSITDRLDY
jgi:7-cyano-7-deazaguanine synthase